MNHAHAHRHLRRTDPRLAALIAQSRRYKIAPATSVRPFDALAESIAYQQLNGKAAVTIFKRFLAITGDPVTPQGILKLTPEQMRAAVDKLAADGADVVKVFASLSIRNGGGPTMSQEQMNAICDEAKKHGLRVAVHAHGPESVRRLLDLARQFDPYQRQGLYRFLRFIQAQEDEENADSAKCPDHCHRSEHHE